MKKLFLLCSLICLCLLAYSFAPDGYQHEQIAIDIGELDHSGDDVAVLTFKLNTPNEAKTAVKVVDCDAKDLVEVTENTTGIKLNPETEKLLRQEHKKLLDYKLTLKKLYVVSSE